MYRTMGGSDKKLFTQNGTRPETPGETHHLEVLRPLIKVSEYLGSWPKDGQQFILRLTPWNGLTLFILHFYTVHKFFNWMTVVKTTENIFEIFEQLTLIIRTGIVAICFDYRFMMHHSFMKLFKLLGRIKTLNEDLSLLQLRTTMKVIAGICLCFVFLHILFASIFMFHSSTDKYVNWLFYGDAANSTPDFVIRMIMIADWGLYLYLVICNECFFFGMYIAICLTMLFKIKDYNAFVKRVQKERLIKSGDQVQELYIMHTRLSEMISEAERNYSFPSFLWILCIIFNLAVKIESVIHGVKKAEFKEFGYVFTGRIIIWVIFFPKVNCYSFVFVSIVFFSMLVFDKDVIYYTLGFMAICLVASEVGEANSAPIISCIKIAEQGDIEDWIFQQESQLLITKINTPMLKLSGWACFELNMQFMLTILGALATYAIIIMQMA